MAKRSSKGKSAPKDSKVLASKKAKAPRKCAVAAPATNITGVKATAQAGGVSDFSALGVGMSAAVGDLSVTQDALTLVARGEVSDPPDEVARLRLVVMRELEFVRALPPDLVEHLAEIIALRGTGRESNIAPNGIPDRNLPEVIENAVFLTVAVGHQLDSGRFSKSTFQIFYRHAKEVAEDIEWWTERAKNITGNSANTIGNLTKLVAGVKALAAAIGALIGWIG